MDGPWNLVGEGSQLIKARKDKESIFMDGHALYMQ